MIELKLLIYTILFRDTSHLHCQIISEKAAVLAAKENSDLPVWVTMSFEAGGRTFTGTTVAAMAATLDGLGVPWDPLRFIP